MRKKEAKIILPMNDNNGNAVAASHDGLINELCHYFGGYTSYPVQGGWKDGEKLYTDYSLEYTIAMEDTDANDQILSHLAYAYGRMAKQECVYVRYANGDVEFVDCRLNTVETMREAA